MEELLHWTEPRQEERALLRAGLECGGCPSREGAAVVREEERRGVRLLLVGSRRWREERIGLGFVN